MMNLDLPALNGDSSSQLFLPSYPDSIANVFNTHPMKTHEHMILYVLDSLGLDLLHLGLQELYNEYGKPLTSVYPSVTPVAFTSIVTNSFPETHGILGHYYYNPIVNDVYDHLRFPDTLESKTRQKLLDAYDNLSKWVHAFPSREVHVYLPQIIIHGALTKLLFKDTILHPFQDLKEVTRIMTSILQSKEQSIHLVYVNTIDDVLHEHGKTPKGYELTKNVIHDVKQNLQALQSQIPHEDQSQIHITITADHGQINTPTNHQVPFPQELWDRIKSFLYIPKIGRSGRAYHVFTKPHETDKTLQILSTYFSEYSVTLTHTALIKQLQSSHKSPYPISQRSSNDQGQEWNTIHLIFKPGFTCTSTIPVLNAIPLMKANHGSLTLEELLVPKIDFTLQEFHC